MLVVSRMEMETESCQRFEPNDNNKGCSYAMCAEPESEAE